MKAQIHISIRKILNGFIFITDSGNELYFSNKAALLEKISEEIEIMSWL